MGFAQRRKQGKKKGYGQRNGQRPLGLRPTGLTTEWKDGGNDEVPSLTYFTTLSTGASEGGWAESARGVFGRLG